MGAACTAGGGGNNVKTPRKSQDKRSKSTSQQGDSGSKANSLTTSPINGAANPARPRGGGKSLSPKQRLSESGGYDSTTVAPSGLAGGGTTMIVGGTTPAATGGTGVTFTTDTRTYGHAPVNNTGAGTSDHGLHSLPSTMSLLLPLVRQETALYEGGGQHPQITTARTITTESSFGKSYNSTAHPLDDNSRRLSGNPYKETNNGTSSSATVIVSAINTNTHFMGHGSPNASGKLGRSNYSTTTVSSPQNERRLSGGGAGTLGIFTELAHPAPAGEWGQQFDQSVDISSTIIGPHPTGREKERTEIYHHNHNNDIGKDELRPMKLAMPVLPGSIETESAYGSPSAPPIRRSTFAANNDGGGSSTANQYIVNGKGAFSSADGDQSSIYGGATKASIRGLEDTLDSFKFNKEVAACGTTVVAMSDGSPLKRDRYDGLPKVVES